MIRRAFAWLGRTLRYLRRRLAEPSTMAGFAALLDIVAPHLPQPLQLAGVAAASLLCVGSVLMPEG